MAKEAAQLRGEDRISTVLADPNSGRVTCLLNEELAKRIEISVKRVRNHLHHLLLRPVRSEQSATSPAAAF